MRSAAPVTHNLLANLKISCSKMQPFSGNLRPHLLTHLAHVSLLDMLQNPHVLLTWARCRIPCACHAKPHLNLQKWSEHVVNILTWKCAFAPQRRALFQHHNFQKWSQHGVLCTFWLENVFRATMACTFSTPQLSKVVSAYGVLYILTWKCASHHNGVQFFISHLTTWLRTRHFSEPTFRPSGATNHWKNTGFRDFPTFSGTCIFFLLTLSLLWSSLFCSSPLWLFPPLLFHLSILSEVWLLNFLRLFICLDDHSSEYVAF